MFDAFTPAKVVAVVRVTERPVVALEVEARTAPVPANNPETAAATITAVVVFIPMLLNVLHALFSGGAKHRGLFRNPHIASPGHPDFLKLVEHPARTLHAKFSVVHFHLPPHLSTNYTPLNR
jgi:hypothetical protein